MGNSCPQFEDDEDSVFSSQTSWWSTQERKRLERAFLTPHHGDRPIRCILDPATVNKSIAYQAEVMEKKKAETEGYNDTEVLFQSEGKNEIDNDDNITAFSEYASAAPSEFAPTDITTGTGATRVVSNLDRYYTKSRTKKSRRLHTTFEESSTDSASSSSRPVGGDSAPITLPSTTNFSCIDLSWMGIGTKEEFSNALHLSMRAHFLDFYNDHYLPMFPNSPVPPGISRQASRSSWMPVNLATTPRLVPSGSTSSSSPEKSVVDFGQPVASNPVRLAADASDFMDLAITGSFGLVERTLSARGSRQGHRKNPDHYIVLIHRRSGVPLAVCALKSPYGPPVCRLYATKQRIIGQRAVTNTGALGLHWASSLPLYAWAEITVTGEFPLPVQYSMYMSVGSDGRFEKVPSYRATHFTSGSPEIMVVGKTEIEKKYTGCALLGIDDDGFALSISRGIDPALFICFTAIVDELNERWMRLHHDVKRQSTR